MSYGGAPGDAGRFLLVEDNPVEARAVERVLRRYGEVLLAPSLSAAAALVRNRPVTAALVDWKLPDGDGLTFVETLRAASPELPILVMTAYMDRDCINRTHLLGAEYVCKPATLDNLKSFVERALVPRSQTDLEALAREHTRCFGLSRAEAAVLRLALLGVSRAELADHLGVRENTIKTYVKRLLKKTRAESLEALVRRILHETLTS